MDFPSPCLLGSIALAILCILSPFIAHLLYSTAPHREDLVEPEPTHFQCCLCKAVFPYSAHNSLELWSLCPDCYEKLTEVDRLEEEQFSHTPPTNYSGNPQEDAPSYFPNPRDWRGH